MDLAAEELADGHVTLVPFDAMRDGADLRAMAEALGEKIATWPHYAPPADWIGWWLGDIERRTGEGALIPFRVQHPDGRFAGITSPRGGMAHVFRVEDGGLAEALAQADVCGLAAHALGFVTTDGTGGCRVIVPGGKVMDEGRAEVAWDNHLVRLNV